MTAPTTYANPYWDVLRDRAHETPRHPWDRGPFVGGDGHWDDFRRRHDLVSEYAWTITDPATVAFVAQHAGPRVIDPLAGSGYWAYLLGQHGTDIAASDIAPPNTAKNEWHKAAVVHVPVACRDAVDAVNETDRTLLLSWPPYGDTIGARVLAAYSGDRVVYIGEGESGCCGDEDMWAVLRSGWREVAEHRPVQWWGLHDYVTVYERIVP